MYIENLLGLIIIVFIIKIINIYVDTETLPHNIKGKECLKCEKREKCSLLLLCLCEKDE